MLVNNIFRTVLVITLFAICRSESDMDGSPCKQSGVPGICKRVDQCPLAMEKLKKNHRHNLQRCDFDGDMEVICCPEEIKGREPVVIKENMKEVKDDDDDKNKNRKSKKACEDYENKTGKNEGITHHILEGTDAEVDEFSHMAAIGHNRSGKFELLCGASIISEKYLLSAAHCFGKRTVPNRVKLGVTDLNDPEAQEIEIKEYHLHEYNSISKHNDIALIEMGRKVTWGKRIGMACLYLLNDDPTGLIVSGWGEVEVGRISNVLQKLELNPIPREKCNSSYFTRSYGTKDIDSTQLCATAVGSDCPGDSGGPLQLKSNTAVYYIVGIVSYGTGCVKHQMSVYTRVYSYLDWIEKYVWP